MKSNREQEVSKPKLIHHVGSAVLPVVVTIIVPSLLLSLFGGGDAGVYGVLLGIVGAVLMLLGLSLLLATVRLFHIIGKGTLAPWHATKKLVIEGPYRYSRNPMITGVLTILVGEALLFQSLAIGAWALVFYIANTLFFVFIEEPYLLRKHGDQYRNYKTSVSRWIPFVPRRKRTK